MARRSRSPGKDADMLVSAIDEMCVTIHGPMKEMIMDGERAIAES